MKVKFKLLITLIATFCVTLVCGLVAACNPDETENFGDPATEGYVITVLYPNGTPVKYDDGDDQYSHPRVELTDADGNRVATDAQATVNASGIAFINYLVPGEYYINVLDYPTGYMFDGTSVKTSADRAYYTVYLLPAAPTPYTVNVNYPDGTPISNVTVKLLSGTQEVASATTDESGTATSDTIERGDYSVVLENLPEGYLYRSQTTTIAAKPVTITTLKLTTITFEDEDKLEGDDLAAWDNALNNYALDYIRFDVTGDNYAYTAELAAGQEVFFKIEAPKTGAYTIGSKKGNDYIIQFYADDLSYYDDSLTISSATNEGNNVQSMRIEEGSSLIFSVKAASRDVAQTASQVEVLVCMPVPEPAISVATSTGKYTLTFTELNTAILRFVTSTKAGEGFGQGIYRFTSASSIYDVLIVEYVNSFPSYDSESDLTGKYSGYAGNDNGADDELNFVFERSFLQREIGVTVDFHIIIKDEEINFPHQIDVTIERLGDATEEVKEITRNTAETSVSTKYADQSGTFTWMPTDGSLVPYEKEGKWYVLVGGEEKALVAAITKNLSGQEYSFATIEYLADGQTSAERVNTYLTVFEDLTTQDTTWNYTGFIDQYKQYVNKDGVYEVNSELKLFLERYMNQRFDNVTGSTTKPAYPWLLGCGYYA